MSMEAEEVAEVQAVWAMVVPDQVRHGVELFVRLFDQVPETKDLFPRIPKEPEVMRKSARMRAHASRVVTAMGAVINQLGDEELLDETVFLLGDSHYEHGATAEHFEEFGRIFIEYLTEVLGDQLTPAGAAAVEKMVHVFNKKVCQHLA